MESDPVRLQKLILNSFGEYIDTEINLDAPRKIFTGKATAGKTIVDAVVGILYGCPPDRRREFLRYAPPEGTRENFSASLFLTTDDGTEYLIGKDFHHERLEVFRQEGFRMKRLFPATVIEILRKELGTLNPLDFEAFFVFPPGAVEINWESPLLREEWLKISSKSKEEAFLPVPEAPGERSSLTGDAAAEAAAALEEEPAAREGIKERIIEIEEKIKKIKELTDELSRLRADMKELALYEPFIIDDRSTLLEELSKQLTTTTLERKYIEEKIRENRENEETIRREIADLKKKVAAFPQEYLSPEFQEKIKQLAAEKEKKVALLKNLEEQLKDVIGRKGLFSGRSRREERVALEEKITRCTEEISALRKKLATLLGKQTAEEFFHRLELHQKDRADLARLEKHPIHKTESYKEEHRRLLQREAEIRRQMQDLLSLAGSEDYDVLKEKIGRLQGLRRKEREIEEEIRRLGGNGEAVLAALEKEKQRLLEEEEKQRLLQEEAKKLQAGQKTDPAPVSNDPFLDLYRRVGELAAELTGGEYTGILTEFREGKYLVYAREKATATWVPEELLPAGKRDLVRLAIRLFLARFHTPARSFPLFFAAPSFLDGRERWEKLTALLSAFVPEAQIIVFAPETATGGYPAL